MQTQVFKQREDGTIDYVDNILVGDGVIPEGYIQIPEGEVYNGDTGKLLTDAELDAIRNSPKPLTDSELLMLAIADLDTQREIDKTESQVAIAELAETILGGV